MCLKVGFKIGVVRALDHDAGEIDPDRVFPCFAWGEEQGEIVGGDDGVGGEGS